MKIRLGFVSNSSSSSFIVAFAQLPATPEEMQTLLFGDRTIVVAFPGHYTPAEFTRQVWKDFTEAGPIGVQEITEIIAHGHYTDDEHPAEIEFPYGEGLKAIEPYESAKRERAAEIARLFVETHPGCTLLAFRYADEDGPFFAALEHEDTFANLPHLAVNNH